MTSRYGDLIIGPCGGRAHLSMKLATSRMAGSGGAQTLMNTRFTSPAERISASTKPFSDSAEASTKPGRLRHVLRGKTRCKGDCHAATTGFQVSARPTDGNPHYRGNFGHSAFQPVVGKTWGFDTFDFMTVFQKIHKTGLRRRKMRGRSGHFPERFNIYSLTGRLLCDTK
jgi:hypothetical protein